MPYAIVHDIPASWEQYGPVAAAIRDPVPEGLILHVAGPTDEGFRTIQIWATRDAWECFQRARGAAAVAALVLTPATLRELQAIHAVP